MLTGFWAALFSGAAAGTTTDAVFFPIDTLKTRLQAQGGLLANGGLRGVYAGIGSALIASAPGAALFFATYEGVKKQCGLTADNTALHGSLGPPVIHMIAASMGEIAACAVRVPAEVIKQRSQVENSSHGASGATLRTVRHLMATRKGVELFRTLYTGWSATIMREIPFTCIQFPLYEYLKKLNMPIAHETKSSPWSGAICGSIAGGIAAAITTPLDFLKTRTMLQDTKSSLLEIASEVFRKEGPTAFFKGIIPRTLWISAGGAIFLGSYEACHTLLLPNNHNSF